MPKISPSTREKLIRYAGQYETADFLVGDPSWFMHQVDGRENQEAMAFITSCLSYGSRQQFMKKVQLILDQTDGRVDEWLREGLFRRSFRSDDKRCFYRLYTHAMMHHFFCAYQDLLHREGTLGQYVRQQSTDALSAIAAITRYFGQIEGSMLIPKDTQSACKRVCMFLRWMVRSHSPVDLGLWSDFLDRRTLIMPLDTHVLQQSVALGLLNSKTATMSTARRLTAQLAEIFPDDPLKADFALFGYGILHD
ncbi:MAG: TIGR02757 family protein [Bacteroidales bacterium]|nr:TIGR02757 family protein [Bacteroidales bacterium]